MARIKSFLSILSPRRRELRIQSLFFDWRLKKFHSYHKSFKTLISIKIILKTCKQFADKQINLAVLYFGFFAIIDRRPKEAYLVAFIFDQFFQPVYNIHETFIVKIANITGSQPSIH